METETVEEKIQKDVAGIVETSKETVVADNATPEPPPPAETVGESAKEIDKPDEPLVDKLVAEKDARIEAQDRVISILEENQRQHNERARGQEKSSEVLIAERIKELRGLKEQAVVDGDITKAESIKDAIDDLRDEQIKLQLNPEQIMKVFKNQSKADAIEAAARNLEKTAPWIAENNTDYNEDMAMFADAFDRKLAVDPVWSRKPIAEQFEEVKRRTESAFGWGKDKKTATGQEISRITSAGGVATGGGNVRNINTAPAKLTDEEKRVAIAAFCDDQNDPVQIEAAIKRYANTKRR